MKYRIFRSPAAYSGGEISRAALIDTQHGSDAQKMAEPLMRAVRDDLTAVLGMETGSIVVAPPKEDGYSSEAQTRFLSLEALLEAKDRQPLLFHYQVVETVD